MTAMTLRQVADRWGVSYEKLRQDAAASRLPVMRFGKLIRVSWETIQKIESNGGLPFTGADGQPSPGSAGKPSDARLVRRHVKRPSKNLRTSSNGQPGQVLVKS